MSLKQLKTKVSKLKIDLADNKDEIRDLQKRQKHIEDAIKKAEEELVKFSKDKLKVSEHALLRYLERVMGEDLNLIRNLIKRSLPDKLPNGRYPLKGTLIQAIVANNVVVSIVNKDEWFLTAKKGIRDESA